MGRPPTKPRPKHSGQTGPSPGRMTVLIAPVTKAGSAHPRLTCAFETQLSGAIGQSLVDRLDPVVESAVEPGGADRCRGSEMRRLNHRDRKSTRLNSSH